jgi:hypothetical protein
VRAFNYFFLNEESKAAVELRNIIQSEKVQLE